MIDLLEKYFLSKENKEKLTIGIFELYNVRKKMEVIDFHVSIPYLYMGFADNTPGSLRKVDIDVYHISDYNFVVNSKELRGLKELVEYIKEEVKKESDYILNERKQEEEFFETLNTILEEL
ncbi:hypothetical protein [Staphylococcus phage vB_SurM-PSU4]|nr:hypothetical protein [Staphylococcus phage vB_SurM-PSU4]